LSSWEVSKQHNIILRLSISNDDDGEGGLASRLELKLGAAQYVVVVVEGFAKQFGDFTLSVEEQGESNCCQGHPEPGRNAPQVEQCVCAFDSFCCDTEWDVLPSSGKTLSAHVEPQTINLCSRLIEWNQG